MQKRPSSAVGYKRPISQYARVAVAMGGHSRYRVCLLKGMKLTTTTVGCDPPDAAAAAAAHFPVYFPRAGREHHVPGAGHDASEHGRAEPKLLGGQLAHEGQGRPQVSLLVSPNPLLPQSHV